MIPTPSSKLPSERLTDAEINARIADALAHAQDEVRLGANADMINGSRPASRAEAENMILRTQVHALLHRVETLRSELIPMQLALRTLTALVLITCGGEAQFSDEDLDQLAMAGVQFHRKPDETGWLVEYVQSTQDATGRKV